MTGLITIYSPQEFLDSGKFKSRGKIPEAVNQTVCEIFKEVELRGQIALMEYTKKFDGIELVKFKVAQDEIEMPGKYLTAEQTQSIDAAYAKVFNAQKEIAKRALSDARINNSLKLKIRSIERVGIYVPGGKVPLPSSLLMAGATARAAGVKDIFVCTPPSKNGINPAILYISEKLGITEIYTIGGAQAIAAMSLGIPQIIKKADMVCGPGNIYVTAAKGLAVSRGLVKIDMLAGPSEVFVIADGTSNPLYIAADMLAQAEHGPTSAAIVATDSKQIATDVKKELEKQVALLSNRESLIQSLRNYGAIILTKNIAGAVSISNSYCPEHLELFISNPERVTASSLNAGAVFVNTAEVFADYGFTGGNHILPTGGTAKFASALSAFDFVVMCYVEELSTAEQKLQANACSTFAKLEQLEAHAKAALIRKKR